MMKADHRCFCELAPLYALDLLDLEERLWVEAQVLDCPDLAEELTGYQTAVGAMPYSAEPMPMAADLKDRLFDRIDTPGSHRFGVAPISDDVPPLETQPDEIPIANFTPFFTVRAKELQWIPGVVPSVKLAILHTDEVKREQVGLLMAEPGMIYPRHRHEGVEEIYMLSGDLELEGITYYSGDYIRSTTGSTHGLARSVTGCMFFFRSSMDDKYPDLDTVRL